MGGVAPGAETRAVVVHPGGLALAREPTPSAVAGADGRRPHLVVIASGSGPAGLWLAWLGWASPASER